MTSSSSPGTYLPAARVTDSTAPAATPAQGIQNLATVRVVIK